MKTQSRQQWEFIAQVVSELLKVVGVGVADADAALRDRFGESGLGALIAIHNSVLTSEFEGATQS